MKDVLKILITQLASDTLCVISGARSIPRNGDVYYPFRQNSDFLYLTGLSVPGLVLTVYRSEVILWREPIVERDRIWWSDKLTDDDMVSISGITDIREMAGLDAYREEKVYAEEKDIKKIIHQMRMIKTPKEIEQITQAVRFTEETYEFVRAHIQPGMYEYEIEAMIAYQFRLYHGIEAFSTIVASGPNSCVLHYTKNTRKIEKGDLVLLDFGIEQGGYGADISRTFTIGWVMTERQQQIYDAVEDAKRYAESILRPGISRNTWNKQVKAYMYNTCKYMQLDDIHEYDAETNPYFPHSIWHFLWLDTHDVGDMDTPLEPGMVLTIEPGIYIREEDIGIRIEDDYMIIPEGNRRLT